VEGGGGGGGCGVGSVVCGAGCDTLLTLTVTLAAPTLPARSVAVTVIRCDPSVT
jgi:hypothetical protein